MAPNFYCWNSGFGDYGRKHCWIITAVNSILKIMAVTMKLQVVQRRRSGLRTRPPPAQHRSCDITAAPTTSLPLSSSTPLCFPTTTQAAYPPLSPAQRHSASSPLPKQHIRCLLQFSPLLCIIVGFILIVDALHHIYKEQAVPVAIEIDLLHS